MTDLGSSSSSSNSNSLLQCSDPHIIFESHGSRELLKPFYVANDDAMIKMYRQIQAIRSQKHFIAVLLHNSQHLFDHWYVEFIRFIELIGDNNYSNVFVSIHESGSTDNTPTLLMDLKERLVRMDVSVDIETSLQPDPHQQSDGYLQSERIEKLVYLRNRALRRLTQSEVSYDNVVYVNDVFFCATDLLMLVVSSLSNDADVTCSVDIYTKYKKNKKNSQSNLLYGFYDIWVAKDINGQRFNNFDPMIQREFDREHWRSGRAFQVFSCWNGVVVIKADIFQRKNVRFRAARRPLECAVSECEVFARDLWAMGRYRIIMEPKVVVTYNQDHFVSLMKHIKKGFITTKSNWVEDIVRTMEHRVQYQTTPPTYVECCSLREKRKFVVWNDCFMEHHWSLAYELLGKPWDESATVTVAAPPRNIVTINDAYSHFRNRIGCNVSRSLTSNQIPQVIHQIGSSHLLSDMTFFQLRCMISWWDQNRCYDYRYIGSDEGALAVIRSDARSRDLTAADFSNGGEIADYARYVFMYQQGGVYAAVDAYAIAPIDSVIKPSDTHVVGHEEYFLSQELAGNTVYTKRSSLSPHLFASLPKSDVLRQLINVVHRNLRRSPADVYDQMYATRVGSPIQLETALKTGSGPFTDAFINSRQVRQVLLNGIEPFSSHLHDKDSNGIMVKSVISSDSLTVAIHYSSASWVDSCPRVKHKRVTQFDYFTSGSALVQGQWIASYDKVIPDNVKPLWQSSVTAAASKQVRNSKHFHLVVLPTGFGVYTGRGPHDKDRQQVYSVTFGPSLSLFNAGKTLTYLAMHADGYLQLNIVDRANCSPMSLLEPGRIKRFIFTKWNSAKPSKSVIGEETEFIAILRSDGRLAVYKGSSPSDLQ